MEPGASHGSQGLAIAEQGGLADVLGPGISLGREGASGKTEVESPANLLRWQRIGMASIIMIITNWS